MHTHTHTYIHTPEHPTLDFGSGHDPRVMGSSPALGSPKSLLKILSLSLCPPHFYLKTHTQNNHLTVYITLQRSCLGPEQP